MRILKSLVINSKCGFPDLKTLFAFIKIHPFLFLACLISLFFGLFPCAIFFNYDFPDCLNGLFFLIPVVGVFVVTYIATKTFFRFPIWTRIITFCLNLFFLLFVQVYVAALFAFDKAFNIESCYFDKPADYQKAISKINYQNRIYHFPTNIPAEAKNISFYMSNNPFFGSEYIFLKYTADEKYIKEKIQIYENSKIKVVNFNSNDISVLSTNGINTDGFVFYLFGSRETEKPSGHHFPYKYGVAINKEKNQIIYFYESPD